MSSRITGRPTTTPVSNATPVEAPKPLPTLTPLAPLAGASTTSSFTAGGPALTTRSVTSTAVSPKLLGLIDAAKTRLYLHVNDLSDVGLQTSLVAAAKRGVDVRLVYTPKKALDPAGTLDVLRLTDDGLDIAVKKSSKLKAGVGVSDDTAFTAGTVDPVVGEGPAAVTAEAALVAQRLAAFAPELEPVLKPGGRTGLLAPGQVSVHEMPHDTAAPILNAINSATKSIDLELYQLGDRTVIDALCAAAKRGVTVRVMLEPKTVGSSNYAMVSQALSAAGVSVQPTPPQFDSSHNVDHAKFMVIDQAEVLVGTGNLVRYGLGGNGVAAANSRDFWVEDSRAPAVSEAGRLFAADWARQPTQSTDFTQLVVTPDNADSKILSVIDAAKTTLRVYNQSLDNPELVQHLLAAKARGVDVKVLLGCQPIPHQRPKNDAVLQQLQAAGIGAEYLTTSYLHAKAVITETQAFVGSQNFTNGGLTNNREVGEVLTDPAALKSLTKQFTTDFASPGPQP
jgi:phosphatidylserine/phosphatidylglycerophosphate/cardiolipin synthase-like enzyme